MTERGFRIYRSESGEPEYLGKINAYLADRPGSLAALAGLFARYGINITYFYYNRSEDPNRVLLEVKSGKIEALQRVGQELAQQNLLSGELLPQPWELGVLDTQSILKVEVQLAHRPGTLGRFATLLRDHGANVIYMAYNEDISENSASVSVVTEDPLEIDRLLKGMNVHGYFYTLHYKGAEQKEVEDIIGLNLVERFFFRLKRLLDTDDIERLKRLVHSSQRLTDMLIKFSREAGRHLDAGEVLTNVLAFASVSLSKSGVNFSWRRLPSICSGMVTFHAFRIPTGGNIFVLESAGECLMIDGGYGHYYNDVKAMLRENGLDPGRVRRIYVTHPDADHAGMTGYFAEEFGSRVYLHRHARGVLEHENRAWGSNSPILDLNHYFTVLVNEFTKFRAPRDWIPYGSEDIERIEGLTVIDSFELADQTYKVLESTGGHVPGQVFFVSHDSGLVFTGDFLLLVDSLSQEDREALNLPKFMMTSTNADSQLFRQEMKTLKEFIVRFDEQLEVLGRGAVIVPGHGDYYSARRLR